MAMRKDTGLAISTLKVDGGAVDNNLLMQLQASISETKIIRPKITATTAFGAALAAAIGAGLTELDQLKNIWQKDHEFTPEEHLMNYIIAKKALWTKTLNSFYQNS
jgi:glycerol kinase